MNQGGPVRYDPWNHVQILDDFDRPLTAIPDEAIAYRYYSHLNGNRGTNEGGIEKVPHGFDESIPGRIRLYALQNGRDISWTGLWFSLNGLDSESDRVLNLDFAMPWPIANEYQFRVADWEIRMKGEGLLTVRFEGSDGSAVHAWTRIPVSLASFATVGRAIPQGLGEVKTLRIISESQIGIHSNLTLDQVRFLVSGPSLEPFGYGFLTAYAQMLRCYDPKTGLTRDRGEYPSGNLDSTAATGFQALLAAAAWDLGMVSLADAKAVAEKSIHALLSIQDQDIGNWLPQYIYLGQHHPKSDWSTLDTALALLPALQAAIILELDSADELRQKIAKLDFDSVTTDDGQLSLGFDPKGNPIPIHYTAWGSEIALISILRAYQDSSRDPLAFTKNPPAWAGRGHLYEMGSLLFPHLGAPGVGKDQYGVDWHVARLSHFDEQRTFDSFGFFGRSPVEIIDEQGRIAYLAAGIGDKTNPPVDSLDGFQGPWIAPYYQAMTSGLNPAVCEPYVIRMINQDLMPPLSGPVESFRLDSKGLADNAHTLQNALHAAFSALGYYHAVRAGQGGTNVVYETLERDARLNRAVETFFNGISDSVTLR